MKRNVTEWTMIVLLMSIGLSFAQSYSEDFEDGDISDWQQFRAGEEMIQVIDNLAPSVPDVLIGGGDKVGYIQDLDASYTGAAILLMGDPMDTDYTVEADVYVYQNASLSAYTGIVAYADSSKNYYVKLVADFDASNRFRLYNNKLNTATFQYSFYAEPPTTGIDKTEGWHKMKIHVSTDPGDSTVSYHCWYDEVDLGTYIDDAAGHTTSGQPGVFAFQQDIDGVAGYFDNFVVTPAAWVGVHESRVQPVSMSLKQNFPNPFNPTTTISFDINEAGNTALQIFNIKGEVVKTLASGQILPGSYQVTWDGTNNLGQLVSTGSYLIVLKKGNEQLSRSMLMIK